MITYLYNIFPELLQVVFFHDGFVCDDFFLLLHACSLILGLSKENYFSYFLIFKTNYLLLCKMLTCVFF